MKPDTQLLIITLLIEDEVGNHKVIKRDAKFFDDELKEFEEKSTPEKIIHKIKTTGMDVYEINAYMLPEKTKLESLLPTAFTLRHENLEQIIFNHFEGSVIHKLYKIAKTKPQYILSIAANVIVNVSERITPDIEDHIYSELCKYSD
jgi:hypothetical protein